MAVQNTFNNFEIRSNSPEIRGALIHREVLAEFTGFLNHLNPTGTGPDDGNAFVLEVDIVVWPMSRVEHIALKVGRAFEIRFVPVSVRSANSTKGLWVWGSRRPYSLAAKPTFANSHLHRVVVPSEQPTIQRRLSASQWAEVTFL